MKRISRYLIPASSLVFFLVGFVFPIKASAKTSTIAVEFYNKNIPSKTLPVTGENATPIYISLLGLVMIALTIYYVKKNRKKDSK